MIDRPYQSDTLDRFVNPKADVRGQTAEGDHALCQASVINEKGWPVSDDRNDPESIAGDVATWAGAGKAHSLPGGG